MKLSTNFNRLVVLSEFMILVGFLAWLAKTQTNLDIIPIIGAVAAPVGMYVGIKGQRANPADPGGD